LSLTRAKKSLGQHFLVDRRVLGRILDASELSPDDVVVEIGPGRGVLTKALASRVKRVAAVELDRDLADRLALAFQDSPNVEVVNADARDVTIESLVPPGTPYKVVANLPYYAASPIVRRFLEAQHSPELMVFMVQREVARSMAASPGGMTLLSVMVQLYGEARIVGHAPPRAFRPAPKVTSAIVRVRVLPEPPLALDSTDRFMDLVKAGFSAPRKQIRNCLRHGLGVSADEADTMLTRAGIDPKRRPQTLSVPDWGQLYTSFRATVPG
jgi:16S rRNA (adenine1518-N6/adenine1519-N6)-dimethyltransferase